LSDESIVTAANTIGNYENEDNDTLQATSSSTTAAKSVVNHNKDHDVMTFQAAINTDHEANADDDLQLWAIANTVAAKNNNDMNVQAMYDKDTTVGSRYNEVEGTSPSTS